MPLRVTPGKPQAEPGTMRDRLEVQAPIEEADDYGTLVRSWVTIATVWARVRPLGSEPLPDDGNTIAVQHEVTIRYFPGLSNRNRLLLLPKRRKLDILGLVDVAEAHAVMKLDCLEKIKRGDGAGA